MTKEDSRTTKTACEMLDMADDQKCEEPKSKCCKAPIVTGGIGDFHDADQVVTQYMVCTSCDKPCDIQAKPSNQRKFDPVHEGRGCPMDNHTDIQCPCGSTTEEIKKKVDKTWKQSTYAVGRNSPTLSKTVEGEIIEEAMNMLGNGENEHIISKLFSDYRKDIIDEVKGKLINQSVLTEDEGVVDLYELLNQME